MNVGGASSFATSISTKAHLGHSNDRNPGVLLTSFMVARQLGQLLGVHARGAGLLKWAGLRGLCPLYHALRPRDSGTPRPDALVERAALVLATASLGLFVGIEEPVLLRLLAEAASARPGNAELGRHGTDGDAVAEQGGGLFEWLGLRSRADQVSPRPSGISTRLASNGRPASPM